MEINFGKLKFSGDFILKDIKELGEDRDFFLDLKASVIEVNLRGSKIQFPNISTIVLRASLNSNTASFHILKEKDLYSAIASFDIDLESDSLEIIKESRAYLVEQDEKAELYERVILSIEKKS